MEQVYLIQDKRIEEMKLFRKNNNIRCINCKNRIKYAKGDYETKPKCKTCHSLNPFGFEYLERLNLYEELNGKWVKVKSH